MILKILPFLVCFATFASAQSGLDYNDGPSYEETVSFIEKKRSGLHSVGIIRLIFLNDVLCGS